MFTCSITGPEHLMSTVEKKTNFTILHHNVKCADTTGNIRACVISGSAYIIGLKPLRGTYTCIVCLPPIPVLSLNFLCHPYCPLFLIRRISKLGLLYIAYFRLLSPHFGPYALLCGCSPPNLRNFPAELSPTPA